MGSTRMMSMETDLQGHGDEGQVNRGGARQAKWAVSQPSEEHGRQQCGGVGQEGRWGSTSETSRCRWSVSFPMKTNAPILRPTQQRLLRKTAVVRRITAEAR